MGVVHAVVSSFRFLNSALALLVPVLSARQ